MDVLQFVSAVWQQDLAKNLSWGNRIKADREISTSGLITQLVERYKFEMKSTMLINQSNLINLQMVAFQSWID